ncbi:peptidylprolyl isomerase [Sphingosinicella microcystinivorans]|uniref:peptidylprolyl isomerase n=1 Tax=Sphingosinicella microcystinivorans TaxID=335406 RepID=UPI0022F3FF81|nr:peptidylprolyl isomerase [Sphingosinicella microcystinivorans]WBX86018.1 peptidylprolyl isomerase [Sphingosinicella microcystinivorans]
MKALIPLACLLAGFAPLSSQGVIDASRPEEWRPLVPEDTLYMDAGGNTVVMELAPDLAPRTVSNIRALVREGYFDGLSINRVQDNYVVQWGDPDAEDPAKQRKQGVPPTLSPEFGLPAAGIAFTPIPGPDGFGEPGFVNGFAATRKDGAVWATHCYAALGVGRAEAADSGNGSELYVVIGHAPRHLDRNVTIAGRVISGVEHLSSLKRGTGSLGFYETAAERVPIARIRLGSDVPAAERLDVEIMRTDSASFRSYVDARAHRTRDGWFASDAGFIDLCNVRGPQRARSRP